VISGQAVATGKRIARAAATMMRWQLTFMAITVAGARRTAQPHICRLFQPDQQQLFEIVRRVECPMARTHADASLGELHEVIIAAMGWDGGHLHMFCDDTTQYGITPSDENENEDEFALADVLVEPGDRLRYTYDFGDEWDHDVKLEQVLPPDADPHATAVPVCLAGKGK
jgi:Plasmid pRiA4b ORF-3-like protein